MLMSIPVYAVMVEDLGERGAHYMAYKEFCKEMYEPLRNVPEYSLKIPLGNTSEESFSRGCEKLPKSRPVEKKEPEVAPDRGGDWYGAGSIIALSLTLVGAFVLGNLAARRK
jgi:hypothetical protein